MTLDTLDGCLHAIAIGPKAFMRQQWMPGIWGDGDSMMQPVESIEKLNQILGLIMRMFNMHHRGPGRRSAGDLSAMVHAGVSGSRVRRRRRLGPVGFPA